MWSRFDMQKAPPDILISNYSMIRLMLGRDYEKEMLDKTKEWLEIEGNKFTLVLDESILIEELRVPKFHI